MSIIQNLALDDLGFGACLALWGFISSAINCRSCRDLAESYYKCLHREAGAALVAIRNLTGEVGRTGRRKIILMPPRYMNVTADELSLAAALSAAQARHRDALQAHLVWLMSTHDVGRAIEWAEQVGSSFARRRIRIRKPEIDLSPPVTAHSFPNVSMIGHG